MRVRDICISLAAAVFVTGLLFIPGRAVSASEDWDPQTIQIGPSEIEASSILSEPGFSHSPYNLFNTSTEDCWTEGAPGNGIGENLTFFFTDDVELTSFSILPGFHKSEKLFYENGAPTLIRFQCGDYVEYFDLDPGAQTFGNGGWMSFDFSKPVRPRPNGLKLTIEDVREGTRYEDTCITQLRFFGTDPELDVEGGGGSYAVAPMLMDYQVAYLSEFAHMIYLSHTDWSMPYTTEFTSFELTKDDMAYGAYWYVYNQIDERVWVDEDRPYSVAVVRSDLKDIYEELYGSAADEAGWAYFIDNYVQEVVGNVCYLNGVGDFGSAGDYLFDDYYNDGMEGKNYLTIRGSLVFYDPDTGAYDDYSLPYRVYYEPNEGNALWGWSFASLRTGYVY